MKANKQPNPAASGSGAIAVVFNAWHLRRAVPDAMLGV